MESTRRRAAHRPPPRSRQGPAAACAPDAHRDNARLDLPVNLSQPSSSGASGRSPRGSRWSSATRHRSLATSLHDHLTGPEGQAGRLPRSGPARGPRRPQSAPGEVPPTARSAPGDGPQLAATPAVAGRPGQPAGLTSRSWLGSGGQFGADLHQRGYGGRDRARGRARRPARRPGLRARKGDDDRGREPAVRGALAGASTEPPMHNAGQVTQVTVNDAHGPMRSLLPDLLHPAADLIRGRPKPMGMLEGLSGDFDATVCVGYHARAGALGCSVTVSWATRSRTCGWTTARPARSAWCTPPRRRSGAGHRAVGRRCRLRRDDWLGSGGRDSRGQAGRDRFAAELRPVTQATRRLSSPSGTRCAQPTQCPRASTQRARPHSARGRRSARGPGASRIRAGSPYPGRSLAVGVGGVTAGGRSRCQAAGQPHRGGQRRDAGPIPAARVFFSVAATLTEPAALLLS